MKPRMKGFSYRERDYAFGQSMLSVRVKLGLTQTALAELLGVRRRAVIDWEGGLSYPNVDHLKHFVTLAIERRAFSSGHEAEEVHALWEAAHQKIVLNEGWLHGLLSRIHIPIAEEYEIEDHAVNHIVAASVKRGWRVDWDDAPDIANFYGREWELEQLSTWVTREGCRIVSVLGQGGIGKSVLATKVMRHIVQDFEVVIWRSLRDIPTCESLLDSCLQVLAPQAFSEVSASLQKRQALLLECLRNRRVLLVYDNLESFLGEGESSGRMRAGYDGFSRVLRQIAETEHQSCLLLTSREKPDVLLPMEGSQSPVRALRLNRLDGMACQRLLAQKGVVGSVSEYMRLVDVYAGNPLALKIVAQTIVELFEGQVAPFLEQGEIVFGGVRALLDEQYARLSVVERSVLLWLSILREPVRLRELLVLPGIPLPGAQMLEAIESLQRRSLIEVGKLQGSFTLQTVVMEYTVSQLIAEVTDEIRAGYCTRLIEHSLELATSWEYVRLTQQRLLVLPVLARLRRFYPKVSAFEAHLRALLDELRGWAHEAQGYGPANLLALLRALRGHLRGLDLSQLSLRGVYLQGVEMQDTTLVGATLQETIFAGSFDAPWSVVASPKGLYWAMGSRRGEIRLWRDSGKVLSMAWQGHRAAIQALAFSPGEPVLATGSWDGTLKVWDLERDTLRWMVQQGSSVLRLAFAADGHTLATAGDDGTIQFWDVSTGELLQTLTGQGGPVYALAWSPDGCSLASGSSDGTISLWDVQKRFVEHAHNAHELQDPRRHLFKGHVGPVWSVTFSPDGRRLASGSFDQTVRLWDVERLEEREVLTGHTAAVNAVAWSPNGKLLASGSRDHMIWLWDVELSCSHLAFYGHTAVVHALAFMPDSRSLLSGSEDGTLRLWDVEHGQCLRVMQGYSVTLYDVAWNVDGTQLSSAGSDTLITVWERHSENRPRLLHEHSWIAYGVAWSPDGQLLASSGLDNSIQVWQVTSYTPVQTLRDSNHADTSFFGMAWSPDGRLVAAGSYQRGVQVWDVATGIRQWVGDGQNTTIRQVAWSPDGTRLASCGYDGSVILWEATTGRQQARLQGHHGIVMCVVWSSDGAHLASGGEGRGKGEIFIWDAERGEPSGMWRELDGIVDALVWNPVGTVLISGGSDGMIRWWDVQDERCIQMREGHQGTVQSLKVSPDGSELASCGDDGVLNIWDLKSAEHLRRLQRDRPYERLAIAGIQGVTGAQKMMLQELGAIESQP